MWPVKRGSKKRHLTQIGWALSVTLILAGATATGLVWLIWRLLGAPPLTRPQVSLGDFLDVVKIALAIVAGIGGVVALVVAYRRQRVTERADAREDNAHVRADQAEQRERTRLFNERFQMASQMLGDDKAAVRLAGVHAIANLADDWNDHEARQMCIDVLCSYLRMAEQPAPPPSNGSTRKAQGSRAEMPSTESAETTQRDPDREVRHTILRTIAAHLRRDGSVVNWHGHDFDLTGVTFDIDGLDLTGAQFPRGNLVLAKTNFMEGTVFFTGAQLTGGNIYFMGAKFAGGLVSFGGADFSGGHITFDGAEFSGSEISFNSARFTGSLVQFVNAQFNGGFVDFGLAAFSGGLVDFHDAKYCGGRVVFQSPREWFNAPTGLRGDAPGLELPREWSADGSYMSSAVERTDRKT